MDLWWVCCLDVSLDEWLGGCLACESWETSLDDHWGELMGERMVV